MITSTMNERIERVSKAAHLEIPDRVPCYLTTLSNWVQRSQGADYKDVFYDFDKAGQAAVDFVRQYPILDIAPTPLFMSGKANEIAGSQMIDWPGRPGTKVSNYSSHQVIELELMTQEEYPEVIHDFTGFMLRKYIPRGYKNLQGTKGISITPTSVLGTGFAGNGIFNSLATPEVLEAFTLFSEIGKEEAKVGAALGKYSQLLAEEGFPGWLVGSSEAPYDILGDFFRGTIGIFEDLTDESVWPYMDEFLDILADQQIASLQYLRFVEIPDKKVFFPLHKGMDGFMSDKQFERFYWKPLKKIMMALIDMDAMPYVYTEGPYNTRLSYLADVPKAKVIYHFEKVDMKEAKRVLGGIAAIDGNLSVSRMEFGKKEDVIDDTKRLLDICAPDGGYLFNFNGSLDNCKKENFDAVMETLEVYGKY